MLRQQLLRPFHEFFRLEAASGLVLLAATALALIWANSPFSDAYDSLWHRSTAGLSLRHWVNDGLMALFFFVVGIELKRELVNGELSSREQAALPVAAALGGMIVPGLIYALFNWGLPTVKGWGIPMATDIAFALGVLSLLGKRVPTSLRVFLTALAIVDDLGAILVIALFYTAQLSWLFLFAGLGLLGGLYWLNRLGMERVWGYGIPGLLIWLAFLQSGVHATVGGVLLAMVVPAAVGAKLEQRLHPWVSFGIMPLFAFANAGVVLTGGIIHPVSLGILCGLVLGKQIGITLFAWLAVRLKFASVPKAVSWRQLYGVAWLGGIGFTMSLFIATLALGDSSELALAKIGIFAASVICAAAGSWVLHSARTMRAEGRER